MTAAPMAPYEAARAAGVHHIIERPHQGLSRAFLAGLEACLEKGADVIVNTDADNQYDARDIPKLVQPVLEGSADIVIGSRPVAQIAHFSFWKKRLQHLGSWVVRVVSQTNTPDAPSGFRALSREAAMRTHVFNPYTYTLETVIQAGLDGMAITSVPVRVNQELRPSRLVTSIPKYIRRQVLTIFRIFVTYKALCLLSGQRLSRFPGRVSDWPQVSLLLSSGWWSRTRPVADSVRPFTGHGIFTRDRGTAGGSHLCEPAAPGASGLAPAKN